MLRLIVAAPLLLLAVLFALSNRDSVHLSLWPVPGGVDVALSLAMLGALAVGLLFGALMTWLPGIALRRRARRAERLAALLEDRLRARPAAPVLPPPA